MTWSQSRRIAAIQTPVIPVVGDLDVPVRFIGVGEAVEDLDNFDKAQFVEALFHA